MFAALSCVGTGSGFNRTLTNQTNFKAIRLTSNSLGLQSSRLLFSPKCKYFGHSYFRRSPKYGDRDKPSKDSTQRQHFQEVLDETKLLKDALNRNSKKVDQILKFLSELQVDGPKNADDGRRKYDQSNSSNGRSVLRKRKFDQISGSDDGKDSGSGDNRPSKKQNTGHVDWSLDNERDYSW